MPINNLSNSYYLVKNTALRRLNNRVTQANDKQITIEARNDCKLFARHINKSLFIWD